MSQQKVCLVHPVKKYRRIKLVSFSFPELVGLNYFYRKEKSLICNLTCSIKGAIIHLPVGQEHICRQDLLGKLGSEVIEMATLQGGLLKELIAFM